jgi:hypothetical protein
MTMNKDNLNTLENTAHNLDRAIEAIIDKLDKCELDESQRATVNTLYGKLWNASGEIWDLLNQLNRTIPPFGKYIPDDYPLTNEQGAES